MADSDSLTLKAHCHCKSTHLTLSTPRSALPLPIAICHCTYCRTSHGTLASFRTLLPAGIKPVLDAAKLRTYVPVNGHLGKKVKKYFCGGCGCPVGEEELEGEGRWSVCTAIFEKDKVEDGVRVWEFRTHVAPGAVKMGGLFRLLPPSIDGVKLEIEDTLDPDAASLEAQAEPDGSMRVSCHCTGVSFIFTRPNSTALSDPIAKRYVSPSDSRKWVCGLDHCSDCRLITGANVTAWSFTLVEGISPRPEGEELRVGSSRMYASSDGVKRTFCYGCGATVFFWRETRGMVVDVPVGLMKGEVMVEEWVTWVPKMVYVDDGKAFDPGFVEALERGYERWLEEK